MEGSITILIASRFDDDLKHVLSALSGQMDFFIAGAEKDETGIIIASERIKPDIVILDMQLSNKNGIDLIRIIHRRAPSAGIIIIGDDNDYYENYMFKTEISGFLIKNIDYDKLASIVKIISMGGMYVSKSINIKIMNSASFMNKFPSQTENQKYLSFTAAERSVVMGVAEGYSDRIIAKHLNYSLKTVKKHLTSIKQKTKQENRMQIVIFSLIKGLIKAENLDIWKNNRQSTNDILQ